MSTPAAQGERWTLMATLDDTAGNPVSVFEDFSSMTGAIAIVDAAGGRREFPKSLEPTFVDPDTLYRGHALAEVLHSEHDLLGAEVLAAPGDPSFAEVAACLPPLVRLETYAFVGTSACADKVGVEYGGRTANVDPAAHVPRIAEIRAAGRVLDGLVGGWLPVLRFVYPESEGDWSELVMYAPRRRDNANPRIQPVWYRVCRVEGNALRWVTYVDSYPPYPPRREQPEAGGFYRQLMDLRGDLEDSLAGSMQVHLPDRRLADQARHALVRAMTTRNGAFPKYGVLDRAYGGAEHDGFQDTFTVDVTAMLAWGLSEQARSYIDNYFTYFVRDDGSLVYRGPETGQYGRMLTVVAQYVRMTGDDELLLRHRERVDAVASLLLQLRREAQELPVEDPAHGMIAGWCEADSCLEAQPDRYLVPYLSNSSEAVRGFADLGSVYAALGGRLQRDDLIAWGAELGAESRALDDDLQTAIGRSLIDTVDPPFLPAIAGVTETSEQAVLRDRHDPQFRSYRAFSELMYSGCLTRAQVAAIVGYRAAHRDILLGVPAAYTYNTTDAGHLEGPEMGGFLSHGHAYGLLQHDLCREFLLTLYSLSAHHYTRGTWTAPETRHLDPARSAAPYCVPAQLAVPLLLRWLLVFEDPTSDTLWICKAAPRDWFADGSTVAAAQVPTRWGKISFRIESHLDDDRVHATLVLPRTAGPDTVALRLRVPDGKAVTSLRVDGSPRSTYDPATETVWLPGSALEPLEVVVTYASRGRAGAGFH